MTPAGNFEGRSILWHADAPEVSARRQNLTRDAFESKLSRVRERLLERRGARVRPGTDDKVLAAWNGLMLRALCSAARVFEDEGAGALALANGAFLRDHLVVEGRVKRSWRRGERLDVGFLEDAAAVALGFLDLFELTADTAWLDQSRAVATRMVADFLDQDRGLFFDTPADGEPLLTRPREISDNATPSGTSLALELLARLAVVDDNSSFEELARRAVNQSSEAVSRFPHAFGHLLGVADHVLHGPVEVAIPGGSASLEAVLAQRYVPSLVLARDAGFTALTRGKRDRVGHVCRRYVCDAPTTDPAVFEEQLSRAAIAR